MGGDGPPGFRLIGNTHTQTKRKRCVLNANRLADMTQGAEIRSLNLNCMNWPVIRLPPPTKKSRPI